jgi:AcrR family transcriptional regulator
MTAPWKAKPHRPEYDATRLKIVEAGWQLATQKGVKAMTLNRVAEEAGCARSSVYRYFDSKEDLLSAMIEEAVYTLADEVNNKVAHIDNPEDFLAHGVYHAVCGVKSNAVLRLLLFGDLSSTATPGETIQAALAKLPDDLSALFAANPYFTTLREQGLLRDDISMDDVSHWLINLTFALMFSNTVGSDAKKDIAFLKRMLIPSIMKPNTQ